MNDDINELLAELSRNVQAIGRNLGSRRQTVAGLKVLSDALDLSKKTLDIQIRVLMARDEQQNSEHFCLYGDGAEDGGCILAATKDDPPPDLVQMRELIRENARLRDLIDKDD